MLMLTRRTGGKILINRGQIEVKILYIGAGHVSIGFNAPAYKALHHRVFTCPVGKEIFLDKDQIRLKVLFVFREQVAIGIHAPAHIDVDRKEIFLKKQMTKQMENSQTTPE
jgi:carbon storage regulator